MGTGTYSLNRRFVGAVMFLLLVVLLSSLAYSRAVVTDALTDVADARLATASMRLASLLDQALDEQLVLMDEVGSRAEIRAVVADPSEESLERARALLDSLLAASAARIGMTIESEEGVVLAAGQPYSSTFASRGTGISPFVSLEGRVLYSVASPFDSVGSNGGVVRQVLNIGANPQTAGVLRDLIGREAQFMLGNRSGDLWTDLSSTGPSPPPMDATVGMTVRQAHEGREVVGLATAGGDTPWLVWVALPTSVVMAPLASLQSRMTVATGLLVVLGGVGAWLLGRAITRPVAQITRAADAIRSGDYSRRIQSERRDEVGLLARTFDAMADEIQAGRANLERRVAARTEELEQALTDLESAQATLVRKERLALLGELAGGVSHELRNPLAAMSMALETIDREVEEPSPILSRHLEILRDQIRKSEKIIRDLLDKVRVTTPERRCVDLSEVVRSQLEHLRHRDRARVKLELARDLPRAFVDADHVGQVIHNILTNAIQAMGESNGAVTIRASVHGQFIRVAIHDEGPGIPPEARESVFQPLFTTRSDGIGLGLSISRSLAESNGGSLVVRDSDGPGACFLLTLPASGDSALDAGALTSVDAV